MKILNYIIPILIVVFCSVLYSYFDKNTKVDLKNFSKSIYDYELTSIDGEKVSLKEFKGKKMLVVNVASEMWLHLLSTLTCKNYMRNIKMIW